MATYLVLGSAGQIGNPLVKYLRSQNEQVLEFDIVDGPQFDLRFKSKLLEDSIAAADFVIFLAYDVGGSKYLASYQSTTQFIDNNMAIMYNVFSLLRDKPFIFASSQLSRLPSLAYGTLKNVGVHYTKSLGGIVVNLFNVYGVEQENQKAHVITDFITQARDHGAITARTNGLEKRQFLHALDCSKALCALSKHYVPGTYDVTSFQWTSIFEVAMIVSNLFGKIPAHFSKKSDDITSSPADPDSDILKIWQPTIALEDGIRLIKEELCGS